MTLQTAFPRAGGGTGTVRLPRLRLRAASGRAMPQASIRPGLHAVAGRAKASLVP
jgi:hypothetical protein